MKSLTVCSRLSAEIGLAAFWVGDGKVFNWHTHQRFRHVPEKTLKQGEVHMFRKTSPGHRGITASHALACLLAVGLSVPPLLGQSSSFPTYSPGENTNAATGPTYAKSLANPWVVSDGAIITPAGTQVYLGVTTRAKAVAVNPTGNHTAAVLQMGATQAVSIFNTQTGAVLQTYSVPYKDSTGAANTDSDGSQSGIAYTPDGKYLMFSQDGSRGPSSYVSIANVAPATGLLSNYAQVNVPLDTNKSGVLTTVTCYPYKGAAKPSSGSAPGNTGSFGIPCGYPYSVFTSRAFTSYPLGIAVSPDGKTALAVLDANNTLTRIDLTAAKPVQGKEVRVGQVPNSVVISPDGKTAYVSNEAGPIPAASDFQLYSNGTPVAAEYPTGTTVRGTISVVDLASFKVTASIPVGHHPTGMALWGKYLLVANTYSDSLSVIDTTHNKEDRKIDLGLPIAVPGEHKAASGGGPNSIAVDAKKNIAYVALYNANAVAVVNLNAHGGSPVLGMIPVGYAPSSVVLDTTDDSLDLLIVANDKGIGTTGYGVAPPPANTAENSYGNSYNLHAFNTHQDLGTVSIVPIPNNGTLAAYTTQVFQNNHWDLARNIWSAAGGSPTAKPAVIPNRIGGPSKIKHVFLIIRENRTYDQMLGDVVGGNGDPRLAVFGDASTYAAYPVVTPNVHTMVQRFPLLDNFYDPSRQSADGHNWILQAIAPYSDDIQSPDWLRDYPANGGDAIAYQTKGHLFDVAADAGISMKIYGEYVEYNTFNVPGCTPNNLTQDSTYNGTHPPTPLPFVVSDSCEPTWTQFYNDTLEYESGQESQLRYFHTIGSYSPLPNVMKYAVQNYPQFDLGIPDQYRVDVWQQDFDRDVARGTVPQLSFLWIMSDHTTGPPNATAEQADNDLAIGRVVDIISHSSVWKDSAIFIEEDDAQNGVDHVDGHRSPGYVISPYVKQQVNADGTGAGVLADHTFYTQVNLTRTIEQILGLKPMNQNDLVASPMRTLFVENPPPNNFLPWVHVPNQVPLCYGVKGYTAPSNITPGINTCSTATAAVQESAKVKALRAGWMKMKTEVFVTKYHIPDSLGPSTVSHFDWYEATGFKVPFPGEKAVRPASDFTKAVLAKSGDDDD
jgi:YVTN family beta-propeller protein